MKDIRVRFDVYNLFEIFLGVLLIVVLWNIGNFLLVLGVALIISTFIEDFVQVCRRYKIPRFVSVLAFYLVAFVVFTLTIIFIIPVFTQEVSGLVALYPEIQNILPAENMLFQIGTDITLTNLLDQLQNEETRRLLFSTMLKFFGGIVNLLVIFIVSFYLSLQEGAMARMLRILTPTRYEEKVIDIWQRVQKKIGSWFRGQLIMALILFVLTYATLSLLGIPYAFILSLLTALFELIPYGVFVAGAIAVLVGIGYAGIWMGVGIAAFYFALQQILDLILQPIVVRKLTGIPSLIVIISVFAGAHLFGFYGLLLAIPMALFVMEMIAELEKQKATKNTPTIITEEEPPQV